ncbi:MAG: DHH family phosphoesterase, partial [Candidatus Saccharimonadales bacterium]
FLQPEKTLEKTTDSLRDFIIALDKSKADKLRYKIEDKFVKIFITPYHTSLSDKDLEFSQGDFNVDVVLALGVKKRDELDKTIVEHGRILHDATVISINNVPGADLGAINWVQTSASGLSEMMVVLSEDLKDEQLPKIVDQQIATCFLTGIVAQTDRFSNAKTSPQTMSLAAKLMNAGANQQLIATKLQPPAPIPKEPEKINQPDPPKPPAAPPAPPARPPAGPPAPKPPAPKPAEDKPPKESEDGALMVPHDGITGDSVSYSSEPEENIAKIHIDDDGILKRIAEEEAQRAADEKRKADSVTGSLNRKIIDQPPSMGETASPMADEPASGDSSDPISLPSVKEPAILSHDDKPVSPNPLDAPEVVETKNDETLTDIEKAVNSPHIREVDAAPADSSGLPASLVGPDKGLPPDLTAGNPNPSPPPPVPPPITLTPPPSPASGNLSNPSSGVPL